MTDPKPFVHEYLPHTDADIALMLKEIGLSSIDELFSLIPDNMKFSGELSLPQPHTEFETLKRVKKTLARNIPLDRMSSYLGAGIAYHYIPAAIATIVGRSEFITAYTPYAPEVSQGILQALWEYQSMIAELTGLELVNSSMYDHSTALGEAALMCTRVSRGKKDVFLVPSYTNPERMQTLRTYARGADIKIRTYAYDKNTGTADLTDIETLIKKYNDRLSGIYVETPNYFGMIETKVKEMGILAHDTGALFVSGIDPLSLILFAPPSDYGADIAIGEGQSLGMPMSFGGPGLGIFAIKNDRNLMRAMPGRIIGLTTEKDSDKRAFCMTLQTREQHIRRERATSNICTNNALCALTAATYLSLMGKDGLQNVAELSMARSNLLSSMVNEINGIESPYFKGTHFKEFVFKITDPKLSEKGAGGLHDYLGKHCIQSGIPLESHFPELRNSFLWTVTEMNSLESLQSVRMLLEEFIHNGGVK